MSGVLILFVLSCLIKEPQKPPPMNRKIRNTEKSQIMKYAYVVYRSANGEKTWSNSLKLAWKQAKSFPTFDRFAKVAKERYFTFILIKLNNNTFDAEECFSDCIYKVHRVYNSLDITKNVFTYFYTVVNTTIVDHYRKRTNTKNGFNTSVISYDDVYGDGNNDLTNTFGDVIQADHGIKRKELAELIEHGKNSLSGLQKEIIEMVIFDGHKYKDVAELLNVPINTVKVMVLRGRKKMMDAIMKRTGNIVPV